jgi:hypothetical protein
LASALRFAEVTLIFQSPTAAAVPRGIGLALLPGVPLLAMLAGAVDEVVALLAEVSVVDPVAGALVTAGDVVLVFAAVLPPQAASNAATATTTKKRAVSRTERCIGDLQSVVPRPSWTLNTTASPLPLVPSLRARL